MYQIEKGIPAPEKYGVGRPSRYPFADMEVGDSFFVPDAPANRLACAATWATKRYNRRFITRVVEHGVRVWRVE